MAITPIFIDSGGDQTGGLDAWAITAGLVSIDTTTFHTGPAAIKLDTGSPAAVSVVQRADAWGSGSNHVRRVSYWWRTPAAFPAADDNMFFFISLTPVVGPGLTYRPSGKMKIFGVVGGVVTYSADSLSTLTPSTWYRITFSAGLNGSTETWEARIYINGVLECLMNSSVGDLTESQPAFARWRIGALSGDNYVSYIDDIYIDDGDGQSTLDDPGDVRVTNKRPMRNGTLVDFTGTGTTTTGIGTGTAPYVSQYPLDLTGYVEVITVGVVKTHEFDVERPEAGYVDLSTPGTIYRAVMGWVYSNAGVGKVPDIIVGGVATTLPAGAYGDQMAATPTVYPAGTGADIGLRTSTASVTWDLYECGVQIAYEIIPVALAWIKVP